MGNQHHFKAQRPRDVGERGGAGRNDAFLYIPVARARYSGEFGELLLRQAGGQSGLGESISDSLQRFIVRRYRGIFADRF